MTSLLLHNNNLPQPFIGAFASREPLYPSKTALFEPDYDLEKFIHEALGRILGAKQFDCIFIASTLNNDDYLQFSGLLAALHIRLTPEFRHQHTPIVIVGPDSHLEIGKVSPLDDILYTPGVFLLTDQTVVGKTEMEKFIQDHKGTISEPEHRAFLERIHIPAPERYATYHSLANEWGVKRMAELFNLPFPEVLSDDLDRIQKKLATCVYFKYLEARFDQKKRKIKNKDRMPPVLPPMLDGKKAVYIDDEQAKGWGNLLHFLFEKSGADLQIFNGFKKGMDREQLLLDIKQYLNTKDIADADLYIVDLRLCDQDFDSESGTLTGLSVLKHLIDLNKGNQVVVFTASNKIWNLKAAYENGACGYSIKESPDLHYSSEQTEKLFSDLKASLKQAAEKSYLKKFWATMQKIKGSAEVQAMANDNFSVQLIGTGGWLDQIFTLLQSNDKVNYNQILVNFLSILELYCKIHFDYTFEKKGYTLKKDGSKIHMFTDRSEGTFTYEWKGYDFQKVRDEQVSAVTLFSAMQRIANINYTKDDRPTTNVLITSVLWKRHSFSKEDLDKIIMLRYLRNNLAAHGKNNVDPAKKWITPNDIQFMLETLTRIFL